MTRDHLKRGVAPLVVLTLLALLTSPLAAFAAKGTDLAAEALTHTPQTATGQLLAYEVSFENSGNSTITHFTFNGTVNGGATFHPASTEPCVSANAGAGVSCSMPNLAAGQAVSLVLVFSAPASAGEVTLSGGFSGDAKNGTPGAKQDIWPIPEQSVLVRQASADFFGTYELSTAAQAFSIGSQQLTTVGVPQQPSAYGISIGHSNASIVCGNKTIAGFGEAVELNVANGQSAVTVTIRFASTPGLSPSKVRIVHEANGQCFFPPRDCVENPGNCYDAYWVGSGPNKRVEARIEMPNNGSIKGF